ncbi:MAG: hypothetical protein WAO98_08360 [Alphaproteobacteria bacterium]
MPSKRPSRKAKKRNGIAAILPLFKPKKVEARKGTKAYSRKKLSKLMDVE